MLHEKIKQATEKNHNQLEQLMFVGQIMDGSLTFDEYKRILYTNYLSHAGIEHNLHSNLSEDLKQHLDINSRTKLPALLKDMEEAKITIPDTEPQTSAINTDSDAAILGSMYVLEGATLGGNMIVKRLKTNTNLAPYNLNFHYYQVYGEKLVEKWKQFISVLNTAVPEQNDEIAVKSAVNMFEHIAALQAWPA